MPNGIICAVAQRGTVSGLRRTWEQDDVADRVKVTELNDLPKEGPRRTDWCYSTSDRELEHVRFVFTHPAVAATRCEEGG